MANKYKTPKFRVAFPNVFEAKQINNQGKPKFSLVMLFDEHNMNEQQLALLVKLKDAVNTVAMAKWKKIPVKLKTPFKKGDEQVSLKTDKVYDGFAGMTVLNVASETKPGLVDQDMSAIIEVGEFYGGCFAHATINCYAWEHDTGGRGVSFGLQNIQKIADGDSFAGSKGDPEDDFAAIEVSAGDDDDSLFE